MAGRAKPVPKGFTTINRLAAASGFKPRSLRDMYNRGDLNGKEEHGTSGSKGFRILITNESAADLLAKREEAKQTEEECKGDYTVAELAKLAGVEPQGVTRAINYGTIRGARKIRFKRGGKGGQWRIPVLLVHCTSIWFGLERIQEPIHRPH